MNLYLLFTMYFIFISLSICFTLFLSFPQPTKFVCKKLIYSPSFYRQLVLYLKVFVQSSVHFKVRMKSSFYTFINESNLTLNLDILDGIREERAYLPLSFCANSLEVCYCFYDSLASKELIHIAQSIVKC